jgi:hypothetical protein
MYWGPIFFVFQSLRPVIDSLGAAAADMTVMNTGQYAYVRSFSAFWPQISEIFLFIAICIK